MSTYALDADLARSTDSFKTRIEASGSYVGAFTKAEKVVSSGGTEGVDFSFETDDGATADYLTLWTIKNDGTKTFGYGLLMALMTCLRVRTIGTQMVEVEKWDDIARKRVPMPAECFTELMNKPVGVLLQREPMKDAAGNVKYDKHGSPRWKLNITGFFEPATRMTAGEILDKKVIAERLDRKVAVLKDKPLPDQTAPNDNGFSQPTPAPASYSPKPTGSAFDALVDDLPF
jgi:hypothetical protein